MADRGKKDIRVSTGLGPFGPCGDRFCPGGYRESINIWERIRKASEVPGLNGLELHYPLAFQDGDVPKIKSLLQDVGLSCSLVSATVWSSMKWGHGAFTNPDPKVRREGIDTVKRTMDISEELGANLINLWLGQDGFDYPFGIDYGTMWSNLIEGLRECADHNPRVRICLEYKIKEPRTHLAVGNVGKALYLISKAGLPNIGCNLDVGHALQAYENPSESAILLHNEERLFHLHFNDNYGDWDWDMVPGTVHYWETIELLFWLQEIGYEGWYSLDFWAPREDPVSLTSLSVKMVRDMAEYAGQINRDELLDLLAKQAYPGAFKTVLCRAHAKS